MNTVPSSTFFSAPPDWGWLIVFYFFFGGLAGGCYFLAVLIDLFGRPEDRPLARLGYYISFPCILISGLLLTLDLGRPDAVLAYADPVEYLSAHLQTLVTDVGRIMGAVDLQHFFAPVFLSALAEDGRSTAGGAETAAAGHARIDRRRDRRTLRFLRRWLYRSAARRHQPSDLVRHAAARHAVRGFGGVDIGGFDDSAGAEIRPDHARAFTRCIVWTVWVVALEFIVLIAVMISLGPVFRAWLNAWGLLLFFGVIVLGMLLPLALYWRRQWFGDFNVTAAAAAGIGRRLHSAPGHRFFGSRSLTWAHYD